MNKFLIYATAFLCGVAFLVSFEPNGFSNRETAEAVAPQRIIHSTMLRLDTRSCDPNHTKTAVSSVSLYGKDKVRHTLGYSECRGFDRLEWVRLQINRETGHCDLVVGPLMRGWRVNPDTIGDWDLTTWTVKCVRGKRHYSTTRVPGGDHYVYIFQSTTTARKCLVTKVTMDLIVMRDRHTTVPRVCLDGK